MDLAFFLANVTTVAFYIVIYRITKGYGLLRRHDSCLTACLVSILLASVFVFTIVTFAFLLGVMLPQVFVQTFAYKSIFIGTGMLLYFLYQIARNHYRTE